MCRTECLPSFLLFPDGTSRFLLHERANAGADLPVRHVRRCRCVEGEEEKAVAVETTEKAAQNAMAAMTSEAPTLRWFAFMLGRILFVVVV